MAKNKYLFDFSSSFIGGGLKRLSEYSNYFNINGGAFFLIHPNSQELIDTYPLNKYLVIRKNKLQQLTNNQKHLIDFFSINSDFDLYYSYGIPILKRYAEVNWMHISNILPFIDDAFPLTFLETTKIKILRKTFQYGVKNADIVSAESQASLKHIKSKKLFLSENGSDDEIRLFQNAKSHELIRKDIAVVLGTYRYKDLNAAYEIFTMLRLKNRNLKLIIIGDKSPVPLEILGDPNVSLMGLLPRNEVIKYLLNSKYYLSATLVENSYNAASEGIFLSKTSYISDIPPHRELLNNCNFEESKLTSSGRTFLKVKSADLTTQNIKTWEQVISELILHLNENLKSN